MSWSKRGSLHGLVLALMMVGAVATAPAQPCGNGALDVSLHAGAIANRFGVWTHGQPFGSAWLGIDRATARTATPAGDLCLALTPAFQAFPLQLDSDGIGRLEGVLPADLGLVGQEFHFQAAAIDPMAPGGVALSPLRSKVIHRPRLFVLDNPRGPSNLAPDRIVAYDGLDASVLWTRPTAGSLRFLSSSQGAEIVCVSQDDTLVLGIHAGDGSVAWLHSAMARDMCLGEDPREVLVLTATVVRRIDLRSGVVLGDHPHGLQNPGLFEFARRSLRSVPGTRTVLIRTGDTISALDLDGTGPARTLHQGPVSEGIDDWAVGAGLLAVLVRDGTSPAGPYLDLNVVDINSGQALPRAPVRLVTGGPASGVAAVGFGMTPGGFGFLVSTQTGELVEVQLDGRLGARVAMPGAAPFLVPTQGGGWIRPSFQSLGSTIQLDLIDGATLSPTTVGQIPGRNVTHVTTRRAALYPIGILCTTRQVFAFPTEPPGGFGLFASPLVGTTFPFILDSDLLVTDG